MRSFGRSLLSLLPWASIAALTCAAVLFWLLPASWFAADVETRSHGLVHLDEIDGSVWSGSALVILGQDNTNPLPGRWRWEVQPLAIFSGRGIAHLVNESIAPGGIDLIATSDGLDLAAAHAQLPAASLADLGGPLKSLGLGGQLRFEWGAWHVTGTRAAGHLVVHLIDASSRLTSVTPLGTYELQIDSQGDSSTLVLRTESGPLFLSGTGSLAMGSLSFHGQAHAAPEVREQLADMLSLLGRRDGDNVTLSYGSQ